MEYFFDAFGRLRGPSYVGLRDTFQACLVLPRIQ
jgi:hypothetical protein